MIGQTFPSDPAKDSTGIGDIVLLDMVAFKQDRGLWGVGPGLNHSHLETSADQQPKLGNGDHCSSIEYENQGLAMGCIGSTTFQFWWRWFQAPLSNSCCFSRFSIRSRAKVNSFNSAHVNPFRIIICGQRPFNDGQENPHRYY
jgi:hypothetical protein